MENPVTFPFWTMAVASAALLGGGAPMVMAGADEYPLPGLVTVIPVTSPLLTTATASAAEPESGGATVTAGAEK
jgi:hypothetical protein